MAKSRESREWYDNTIRTLAQKQDMTLFERIGYCFQVLLNFAQKYNTAKVNRDRQWLIVWAKYIRETCILALANQVEGDWLNLYWNVMLLEARHMVVDSYFLYLERKREQHAKFYEPRRELLMKHGVIQALQDLVDDKLDMLSISMPPGTGKSTVIAVIAERLMEIAEKEADKMKGDEKIILVSAFQNDTVEHIASKILTLGIPTTKAGKDTQSIRAEAQVIQRMEQSIDVKLQALAPKVNVNRISKKLEENILSAAKNSDAQNYETILETELTSYGFKSIDDLYNY